MSKAQELYTLRNAEIKAETAKAILVEVDEEEIWIPHSQITDRDDKAGTITMSAWIAKAKRLI